MKKLLFIFLVLILTLTLFGCNNKEETIEDINVEKYDVQIGIECVENLLFSKYDVDILVDDKEIATLDHGATDTYNLQLGQGEHILKIKKYDDSSVDGSVRFMINENSTFKYKISCSNDQVKIELIEPAETKKIAITKDETEFMGMNYKDAEKELKEMGFSVFEYQVLETDDINKADDTIGAVEIKTWKFGKGDFTKGNVYDDTAIVVLWYYDYEEPEKPSPVFFSTNDRETAKKGNTGVFSYREKGSSYDIYWIIDFDEGYVYYFTDGNEENFCDKLKIESGTLNDKITITYHDGGDVWSYRLHFKYVEHPETLIMNDQNGFDWEYSTTDLDDALKIRSTKKIKNY